MGAGVRHQIDLRRMRYVVEVARAETITVAAETLGLTQPAVTRSIAEVEDELGVALFQRVPRGMRLTEAGARFVEQARRILAEVDDLVTEMREGMDAVSGRLRIGCAPGTDVQYALRSLKRLAREFPAIKLEVYSGSSESLCPRLLSGDLNAILGSSIYLERWRELAIRRLCLFHSGCMVRKNHPILGHPNPTEADMLAYPILLPASVETQYTALAQRYASLGLHLQPQYVTDSPLLIRTLIATTDAFHLVNHPDPQFRALREDFEVITGLVESPTRYFCIASSAQHPKTQAHQCFEALLIDNFLGPNAKYPQNLGASG